MICYKLKGKHDLKPDKPFFFLQIRQAALVKCTIQLSHFGFPIGKEDLGHIMNNYLHSSVRKVKEYKVFPGADLYQVIFTKTELTSKFVPNIKKSRADFSEEILKEYTQHLTKTIQNIPTGSIYYYDETYLNENPGLKKISW